MSLIFNEKEKSALRLLIESRSTQKPEDLLTTEELALLDSNNYRQASWNNLSFAPRNGQTRSITMNLVLDSSKSFAEELNAIFNILPLPLHVRIDFWSICYSRSRDNLFIIHPSLNTCVNKHVFLYAFHHQDELIDEIEQGFVTGTLIEKHIENMSRNNESGISLSLVSALILEQFIMKII